MPPRRRSLDDVLRTAEGVLRASRVEHVFVGGVTVLAFGIPRTTTDVDVIAAIEARQIPKIVAGFQKSGFFVSTQDLHDALTEGGHVTVQDSDRPIGSTSCRPPRRHIKRPSGPGGTSPGVDSDSPWPRQST